LTGTKLELIRGHINKAKEIAKEGGGVHAYKFREKRKKNWRKQEHCQFKH